MLVKICLFLDNIFCASMNNLFCEFSRTKLYFCTRVPIYKILSKFIPYKKDAHASYYADKFNGRKTTSGRRFDNNKYTAAHKKLPFGTKVKVTNEANGKSVIVEVTDRGPFVRSREIDLSKRAFMEIAKNKSAGTMLVTIEVLQK